MHDKEQQHHYIESVSYLTHSLLGKPEDPLKLNNDVVNDIQRIVDINHAHESKPQ
jgi:hypothetical protein